MRDISELPQMPVTRDCFSFFLFNHSCLLEGTLDLVSFRGRICFTQTRFWSKSYASWCRGVCQKPAKKKKREREKSAHSPVSDPRAHAKSHNVWSQRNNNRQLPNEMCKWPSFFTDTWFRSLHIHPHNIRLLSGYLTFRINSLLVLSRAVSRVSWRHLTTAIISIWPKLEKPPNKEQPTTKLNMVLSTEGNSSSEFSTLQLI